ncbi:MAG: hypothetical protein L0387_40655 [Acidobacteria bacterium]|nr:hypothetical protein [Acidobacteriota bacterium]
MSTGTGAAAAAAADRYATSVAVARHRLARRPSWGQTGVVISANLEGRVVRCSKVRLFTHGRKVFIVVVDNPTHAKRDLNCVPTSKKHAAGRGCTGFILLASHDAELFQSTIAGSLRRSSQSFLPVSLVEEEHQNGHPRDRLPYLEQPIPGKR